MRNDPTSDGPRPGSSVVPPPPPVLAARTESERRRLADLVPNTDTTPTVISSNRPKGVHTSPDLRGRRLGHFELVEPIGTGGMATVLRATDLSLGRTVALKILPPETDADLVSRFQSEARAAAKLDHENVARVYHCGEDQGLHFIAFEFVQGVNLRDLIDRRGKLPVAQAIHYMLQVATGLAHAADRGVVHRDVKPSNIIITPAGRAKLVDMGLARHQDALADGLTQSGVTLGTFDYISPEQALEPRAADVRSDIYSLGCTFYHALTGRPPVPEGTAAKKLDAHRHIPPPDPRQFNPAIPADAVAVLGRMMAKEAGDRYQRPEHLVHDLLTLARRLPAGEGHSVESGALWVDTALPAPAPKRTAVLAAAAVLAVAILVALIEAGRPTPPTGVSALSRLGLPAIQPSEPDGVGVARPESSKGVVGDKPRPSKTQGVPPESVPVHEVADVERLRELFRQEARELHVRLTGTEPYLLSDADVDGEGDAVGLVFAGKRLVLEAADPAALAVIRFKAAPTTDGKAAAALAVSGKPGEPGAPATGVAVTLRGVRFECDGGPEAPATAVAAADLDKLDAERCAFVLPDQPAGTRPAGAIVVLGRDGPDRPTVTLKDCLFVRGTQAVQLLGRTAVFAQHCCFGPHSGAVVHLRDTGGPDDSGAGTLVRLEHCTALLDGSAVVWADDGAGGTVQAGHCLFSRPARSGPLLPGRREAESGAVLVRQTGAAAGPLVFQGLLGLDGSPQRNGYHNLTAVWTDETSTTAPRRAVTLEDARGLSFAVREDDRRRSPSFRDEDGLELPQSPWSDPNPLARLAQYSGSDTPATAREAFAVNPGQARVRLPRSPTGVLGALHNIWGASYPTAPAGGPVVVTTKIVNPAAPRIDADRGIYTSLAHAVLDAKPGDTILIQKTGPLEVEPLTLPRPDTRLTIRAFPNYRPVLTLAPAAEQDAAMVRLVDGELRLEGLEFALRPGRTEYRSQAVAAVAGAGQCSFHECIVTLEEIEGVTLAAVALPDADPVPRPAVGRVGVPRVRFETCFIRGKGDLLAARAGRRFELDLENTLAALDGSLVSTHAGNTPGGMAAQVRMRRSTAIVTEHLMDLRSARDEEGRPGAGPTPVVVTTEDCLLAAATGRALVRVDGVDADEQVRQAVTWTGRRTAYVNTGSAVLEVVPTSPDRMPQPGPYDAEKWLAFTRDTEAAAPFARVKFANPPGPDHPWARVRPADFRPKVTDMGRPPEALADAGAPLEGLPGPSSE